MGKGRGGMEGTHYYDDVDKYYCCCLLLWLLTVCCLSVVSCHVTEGDVAPASHVRKGDGEENPVAHLD